MHNSLPTTSRLKISRSSFSGKAIANSSNAGKIISAMITHSSERVHLKKQVGSDKYSFSGGRFPQPARVHFTSVEMQRIERNSGR
ncbi:hypothetical protein [Microcoleus sp. B4-D4]|uniref:hypothetical protein n=1 Tax=Microcoleus sp. B4-D4 TaxID=2818667 RepID=UPI002FCEF791